MLRLLFVSIFAVLALGSSPVASAQTDALPAVSGSVMAPLDAAQLNPSERATYDALPAGGDSARQFLYTRGFLRYCRLVIEGRLPPAQLPDLPDEANWNRSFLSAEEGANIVDVALGRQMAAFINPNAALPQARPGTERLPAVGADGMHGPLTASQLDAAEQAAYAALAPGSADARRFLYTRAYLRFCQLVVAGELAPLQLPELPPEENWDRRFLSTAEGRDIVDVAIGLQMMAMMRQP